MFTSGQLLYLDEVLGTTPAAFLIADDGPGAGPAAIATTSPGLSADQSPAGMVVWTPTLSPAERDLLTKILNSVALTTYAHVEGGSPGRAAHVLRFGADDDGATPGRTETAGVVTWTFHPLARMLGASAEVTRLKREVWTLLQEFGRSV